EPWRGHRFVIEGDDVAASSITWNAAVEFCRKLTQREREAGRLPPGYVYCLPTEAERELACRAGSKTPYSSGDYAVDLMQYAVFWGSRSGLYAHRVQQRKPNAWGLYDMHGNVWEWCADEVDDSQVHSSTYRDGIDDPCAKGGPKRVVRGGSYA